MGKVRITVVATVYKNPKGGYYIYVGSRQRNAELLAKVRRALITITIERVLEEVRES